MTRKITRALSRIHLGLEKCLYLGNLNALRDWGHARDYVEMQWKMLQQTEPRDFVIATGRQESIRSFIELSAKKLGWNCDPNKPAIIWSGEGVNEIGRRADNNEIIVRVDNRYFRPNEVETLLGDATKARELLGWKPSSTLEELVCEMIDNDLKDAKDEAKLKL